VTNGNEQQNDAEKQLDAAEDCLRRLCLSVDEIIDRDLSWPTAAEVESSIKAVRRISDDPASSTTTRIRACGLRVEARGDRRRAESEPVDS
jgi:hypothetical protein